MFSRCAKYTDVASSTASCVHAAAAKQALKPAAKAGGPKVGPKGGPLMPTSTNMKHMQKQLNQMQRLPVKLPMTTITERMLATTEKPGAGGDDPNKPMLASVAEKILGNKAAAQAAAQLKEMTPEEKRREIVSRIQAAQRARQGGGAEGASAGLPSADGAAFGGGSAAVMVNASDSPPAKGGWGRAAQALARRKAQEAEGAEGKPSAPHRDRLTSETNVEMARPDEEEDLRPFSAGTAVTMGADSRKSLAVGRARSHAALEDIEDEEEDDKDKPASAGSAATVETLERAGVLAPGGGSGQDQRAVTPTLMANPRVAGLGSGGGPPGSAGSQRDGAASRDTLREQWNARKARMSLDPFQARRMESGVGALQSGEAGPSGSQPHEQPEWPSLMQQGSMAPGRSSVSGAPALNASPSFAQPAEAPPRYSWTGAPSDADALGRTLSSNRQAAEAMRGGVVTPPRASRLGNDPTRLSDLGEYQAAMANGAADDDEGDGLGAYQGYNSMFDNSGAAQGQSGQFGDSQGQQLGGAGAGSGGRGRAGPVAESVVDRVSGGMEDAAVNWVKLQQSGIGPAAASAPLWIPREGADSEEEDDVDGDLDVASWWERRVRASEARVAGAGEEQEARMSSLTAFRADGDPLAVAYEWRVEDPASSDNEPAVLPGRVVAERQLSLRHVNARTRAALARGDSSRSSASAALSGGLPGSTTNGDSSWLAVVDAASASHVKAGPVAEAGERDSNDYGTEHPDLDPSERRRAQAAGIDPVLMRGLSKKNREPEPAAASGGGPTVVRSISGTSLHSTFFRVGAGVGAGFVWRVRVGATACSLAAGCPAVPMAGERALRLSFMSACCQWDTVPPLYSCLCTQRNIQLVEGHCSSLTCTCTCSPHPCTHYRLLTPPSVPVSLRTPTSTTTTTSPSTWRPRPRPTRPRPRHCSRSAPTRTTMPAAPHPRAAAAAGPWLSAARRWRSTTSTAPPGRSASSTCLRHAAGRGRAQGTGHSVTLQRPSGPQPP